MKKSDVQLIKDLCAVFAPSADECLMTDFVLRYVRSHCKDWNLVPEVFSGPQFQECVILKFGNPRTAVFAHMDSVGFTVRYENQLVPIGGPEIDPGLRLVGRDSLGEIECTLVTDDDNRLFYDFGRAIDTGTNLVFKQIFKDTKDYIQSCCLDNRLGVFNALKVAETMEDGLIVFSTREEHGGGSVPFLIEHIYKKFAVKQVLVSDITWVTDGVHAGSGVAISMRDSDLPRRIYLNRIIEIAEKSGVPYQLEVEASGGSDAREIQAAPYPIDWCFVGAPEENGHSPKERVNKKDIEAMVMLYQILMKEL